MFLKCYIFQTQIWDSCTYKCILLFQGFCTSSVGKSHHITDYTITIEIPCFKTQCTNSTVLLVEIVLWFAMIIELYFLKTLEQKEDAALWVFPFWVLYIQIHQSLQVCPCWWYCLVSFRLLEKIPSLLEPTTLVPTSCCFFPVTIAELRDLKRDTRSSFWVVPPPISGTS